MTIVNIPSSADFLMHLLNPAVRALMLAGAAGLALAVFRVKAASARLFAWKTVLYAALAMPLLGWMLPAIAIQTPSILRFTSHPLPSQSSHTGSYDLRPLAPVGRGTDRTASKTSEPAVTVRSRLAPITTARAVSAHRPSDLPVDWSAIAIAFYFGLALLLLLRMSIGLMLGHRVRHAAIEIRDERLVPHLTRCARSFGLSSIPKCAESEVIAVPVTMGVLRPAILLPANWREWDDAKLQAVVAHEMSHVARRDALTQYLSLLHRAIFWFSPLAWWLDRHVAELAEQASDEAALSCGADSGDYAKALLGFFESLHAAPGRVWWQGVAMAKAGQAERRLERILAWKQAKGVVTMDLKKSVVVGIFALAVPMVFLAASVRPANDQGQQESQQTQASPAPSPAKPSAALPMPNPPSDDGPTKPTTPPSKGTTVAPPGVAISGVVISPDGHTTVAPVAPTSPIPPVGAVSPVAPRAASMAAMAAAERMAARARALADQSGGSGYSYAYDYDDEDRFVIVSGKTDSLTMSGSTQDAHHVERLRKQIPGDFIWFQRDEKSYVIRDQATIDRARSFWAPQEELGRKQEELGKQQEALGKQQEAIGHRMEQVRVNVPDMSAELEKLKAELKALGPTATQEQLGDIQSEIGDLQSRIGDVQSQAGEKQSKIGDEMSALGEQQSKLGEQQDELGRQQEKVANEAARKMKELFDESIKNGKAEPEPHNDGGTI
jgi:beta-lactamase regulating signal transducer with metallopeptidase domain